MKPPSSLTHSEAKALRFTVFSLACLAGAGLFLGYANPVMQLPPLVLLLPAVLASYARIMPTAKGCFYAGWLAATMGNSACLYWLAVPMHDFGMLPWPLTVPIILALGAYLGLYGGIFAYTYRLFRHTFSLMPALLLAAPLWIVLDILKGWLFTGFPWVNLATAFIPWNAWVQSASVIGANGLSGIFALTAVAIAELKPIRIGIFHTPLGRKEKYGTMATILVSLSLVYACNSLPNLPQGREITVGLIQGNVDQNQKWEPAYQLATLERYISLSEATVNPELGRVASPEDKADIVIWPETAMPFYLETNPYLASKIEDFSQAFNVPVVFGAPGRTTDPTQNGYHNRLWLQTPGQGIRQSYDKSHLVPFGEYVPLNIPVPFIEYLMQGISFIPGKDKGPMNFADLALGPLICYEAIFPGIARERVAAGANILINVSNDAWFGNTSAPVQHLHLTAMRAIEQGRYVLRATNTGISAVISPKGHIVSRGALFRAEAVTGKARLITQFTLYSSIYPYMMWFCILTTFAAAIAVYANKKRTV